MPRSGWIRELLGQTPLCPESDAQADAGAEDARIKSVPDELIARLAATTAHETLGQGIDFEPFRALFCEIAEGFKRLRDRGPICGADWATGSRLSGTIG